MKTFYVNFAADISAYRLDYPIEAENEKDLIAKIQAKSSELMYMEMEEAWDTMSGFRALSYREGEDGDVKDFDASASIPLQGKLYWDLGQDVVILHQQLTDGTINLLEFSRRIAEAIELRTPK